MENSIFGLLMQLVKNKDTPDRFLASIDGGRVYVSAQSTGGVYVEHWNRQTGAGSASWAGAIKDRLPTEEERFDDEYSELIPLLVCTSGAEYPFRAFYDGKKWGDGWGEVVVTHWMPLPELPEED